MAAVGLGTAIGAPVIGRMVDRFGPFWVVSIALLGQVIGLLGSMLAVTSITTPAPWILGFGFLTGLANPQVGPIARGRWSLLARRHRAPDLIRRAMGYESACDESSFIVGPAMAGVLVGLLGPVNALWALLTFTVIGEGLFIAHLSRQRGEWLPDLSAPDASLHARLPVGLMLWPLLACLAVGLTFGSTQTALTAVNDSRGTPEVAGLIYGSVGIGSAVISILVVRLRRVPLGLRIILGALLAGSMATVMTVMDAPLPTALVAVCLGLGVGVIVVSAITRVEQVAPSGRVNQCLTMASTSITLGVSAGAAVAGQLVTVPHHGYWPSIAAGLIGVLAGVLTLAGERSTPS